MLTKQEKSWILYDWANSAYITIVVAAVFPIFFTGVCNAQGQSGDFWWGIGTAISTALVALAAPLIGTLADYSGNKKKLFVLFLIVGLFFTAFCALTNQWQLMLLGYILSHIGYSGSNLCYDSFLTDVTTKDRMDNVSSLGFAFGYIGGSTIPFILSILLITFGESFGIDATLAVKLSLILAVLWWGLFSIPILKNVKQNYGIEAPKGNLVGDVFKNLFETFLSIKKNKSILFFMAAYFFYIDGVNTIISMATSYGATLGLDSTAMILALLVTQFVAFPCAILFGKLSKRYDSLRMIFAAILVYFLICITGFVMGFGLETELLNLSQGTAIFWVLSVMVGTVQGGIQAISRSYFGKLLPPEKSGEYFGLFDILGKFAAVMGPALYSIVKGLTGRSSFAMISIILLFLVGAILLRRAK